MSDGAQHVADGGVEGHLVADDCRGQHQASHGLGHRPDLEQRAIAKGVTALVEDDGGLAVDGQSDSQTAGPAPDAVDRGLEPAIWVYQPQSAFGS